MFPVRSPVSSVYSLIFIKQEESAGRRQEDSVGSSERGGMWAAIQVSGHAV